MVEFRAKQLHQKAEIGRIDILATRDNQVLAAVTGQIIRSGIFQDKAFTEAFPFTLRLTISRQASARGVQPNRLTDRLKRFTPKCAKHTNFIKPTKSPRKALERFTNRLKNKTAC